MPNWCYNSLQITGKEETLTRFLSENAFLDDNGKVIKGTIDFSRSVPQPDPKPCDFDWYWWNIRNWGTKWNNNQDKILDRDSKTQASGGFDTAWAPPEAWVRSVADKYHGLRFELEYEEPGMDFAGRFIAEYEYDNENEGFLWTNEEQWSPYELISDACHDFFEKYVEKHSIDFDRLNSSNFETEFEKIMEKHLTQMFEEMEFEVDNLFYKYCDQDDMRDEFSDWLQDHVKTKSVEPTKKKIKVEFH